MKSRLAQMVKRVRHSETKLYKSIGVAYNKVQYE